MGPLRKPLRPFDPRRLWPSVSGWRRTLDLLLPSTQLAGDPAAERAGWRPDRLSDYCPRCGATVAPEAVTRTGCPHCRGQAVPWDRLHRLGAYRPPLTGWIAAYKYRGAWAWGSWLGDRLAERIHPTPPAAVVPVPLHWRRRIARGYDQAGLIAHRYAAATGLPLAPLLRRTRPTRPQTELRDQRQRRRNVRAAFRVRPVELSGWTLVLIDDVKTTGATVGACARLLRRAGAAHVLVAVAAVADPRDSGFQRR